MIRALHLLLAVNLLVSTIGVGLFEHLCSVRGASMSMGSQAKSCCAVGAEPGHSSAELSSGASGGVVMTNVPCCQDHASWVQADLDATAATPALSAASAAIVTWPVLAKAELPAAPAVAGLSLKVVQAMRYKPPSPAVDVRVRVHSFQI